ncbi:MAG TPA: ABC-three component system middle component 6 [Dyella sp.]|uniref:ABC-three component system middle component 6 n=1 Tax=Dyella sp. TaxID=1869338 RepID=UPI002C1D206A|nr:ABC-three component system middle component 6 [Dyella sp.]HUB91923.1 ABC-three component system middle component 6 [Dyella sp.]
MLLPDNVHPENTLMYNGALIIKTLKRMRAATLLDLFVETRAETDIGMPLFVLSLDWLYLAECITLDDQGMIALCS